MRYVIISLCTLFKNFLIKTYKKSSSYKKERTKLINCEGEKDKWIKGWCKMLQ